MASADYSHHFSVHNVPFGIASSKSHPQPQAVTRLGNSVVFLHDCHAGGLFAGIEGLPLNVFSHDTLNEFAALAKPIQQQVRKAVQDRCHDGKLDLSKLPQASVADITEVQMHMPVRVGDFAGKVHPRRPSSQPLN
jgi:fumarylacetoacetase